MSYDILSVRPEEEQDFIDMLYVACLKQVQHLTREDFCLIVGVYPDDIKEFLNRSRASLERMFRLAVALRVKVCITHNSREEKLS